MSFNMLELDVVRWAEARKIIPNSTSKAQAIKTLEEAGELLEAATALNLLRAINIKDDDVYQFWVKKYKDAVGDIVVTLINGAALEDVSVVECLEIAHDEIKDRKGYLRPDGVFVKEKT